jgi:hypothetical protein
MFATGGKASRCNAGHLKSASENLAGESALLETHQREIQELRDKLKQAHRLFLDGQITAQGLGDCCKGRSALEPACGGTPKA